MVKIVSQVTSKVEAFVGKVLWPKGTKYVWTSPLFLRPKDQKMLQASTVALQGSLYTPLWCNKNTVFTQLNAPGIYSKLDIVDPAFIWHLKLVWALYSWSNGFSSLIFTDMNSSVISADYYMSNKYFRGLFKTSPWRPGIYSKPSI